MLTYEVIVIRLVIATLIGGVIGIEREFTNRPAGFRTHILVTLGSTLIMLISLNSFWMDYNGGDPGRIAAQVVSGIGFLGAGSIIRNGNDVKGLTTAASIWVCGGLGLAVGSGMYFEAIVAASITLLSLFFNDGVMQAIYGKTLKKRKYFRLKDSKQGKAKSTTRLVVLTYDQDLKILDELDELLSAYSYKVQGVKKIQEEQGKDIKELTITVRDTSELLLNEDAIRSISRELMNVQGLRSVKWKHKI